MINPFKHLKRLEQQIIVVIGGLVLLKVLIIPNPVDILILIGLIFVIVGWFCDGCH
jgi:hypothetical protein